MGRSDEVWRPVYRVVKGELDKVLTGEWNRLGEQGVPFKVWYCGAILALVATLAEQTYLSIQDMVGTFAKEDPYPKVNELFKRILGELNDTLGTELELPGFGPAAGKGD